MLLLVTHIGTGVAGEGPVVLRHFLRFLPRPMLYGILCEQPFVGETQGSTAAVDTPYLFSPTRVDVSQERCCCL